MTAAACLWLGLFPLLQGGTYATLTHDKWIAMLILTGVTFLCFCVDLAVRLLSRTRRAGGVLSSPAVPAGFESGADESSSSRAVLSKAGPLRPDLFPFFLALLLILWTVLSCLCSAYDPDTWWHGGAARYEGLLSQLCYFALFTLFFFSRVNLKPVLLSAAAGAAVFFVIVLQQRGGGNPLNLFPAGRSYALNPEFQGTIGNVDMSTGYLLLLAGLFLHGLIRSLSGLRTRLHGRSGAGEARRRNPLLLLLYPLILAAALVLTLYLIITMDVQFGMISLAVLFLFTLLGFLPKKLRLPLLILLIVLAFLVVWFWPGTGGGIWEFHEILHGRGRLSFGSNRVAVWLYSFRLAGDNLFLGGGSGTFASRFNHYLADHGLVIPREQDGVPLPDYFDSPHSEYIAQLTDHGLPALLFFSALLLFAILRRREGGFPLLTPCSAAVLCYAVQAFFSFSVCIVAPMFWVILALAAQKQPAA